MALREIPGQLRLQQKLVMEIPEPNKTGQNGQQLGPTKPIFVELIWGPWVGLPAIPSYFQPFIFGREFFRGEKTPFVTIGSGPRL